MISLQELFRKCNLTAYALGTYVLRPDKTDPTCWSMIIQHCWIQHVGSSIINIIQQCWMPHVGPTSSSIVGSNRLVQQSSSIVGSNMLVQHRPTLLDATYWNRLNTLLDDDGRSWTSLIG